MAGVYVCDRVVDERDDGETMLRSWGLSVQTLAAVAVVAVLVAVGVTLVALESGEVVVLRTYDSDGKPRDTRTWVADDDDGSWIEAANPKRPFLAQLKAHARVQLRRGGRWRPCQADIAPNPEGHERIRRLLAFKYGWKDRWIGLLTDTSRSLAVRLACA